ncbi:MFS transporter [Mucilaginibacter sp. SMC90]|uniref:MFS transporter n=1 Tax=Mucilaginibacter sp. SMC90 TaxID=2929803 RepID=UPI001FB3859C|nr:MFS transporter [Mucilaginibacter sp. SMC90]UOE51765.1 MFS transporter [Mucilaginibacter sp. SMC90]
MDQLSAAGKSKMRIANSVFFFISGFGYSSWASRIPSIKHQLNLNEAQLGLVLFAMPVGLMLTMPLTAKMIKHFSSRIMMLIGALAFSIILCLPGFMAYMWQLMVVLFFIGSTRNILGLSMNSQAVGIQALYDKSIMVTFHGIWSLAGFGGAAVGYLMVLFNIAPSYHLLFVGIAMLILSAMFYPSTYDYRPPETPNKSVFSMPDKHLLKFSLICFASMACENTLYDWSGVYFEKVVHATKSFAEAGFVVYMVTMTIGRFAGDRVVSAIGVKRVLTYSSGLVLAGLLVSVFLPYTLTVYLGYAMIGLGVSCIVPLIFSMAGKSKTMNSSQALAAISTVGYLGFVIIPPIVGFIAQIANLQIAFFVVAAFAAMMIWMVRKIEDEPVVS